MNAMFSVALVRTEEKESPEFPHGHFVERWIVTCDRCGVQIEADDPPLTIINVKGNIPPVQFEKFKQQLYKHLMSGSNMPIVINTEEVTIHKTDLDLKARLRAHSHTCEK